MQASERPVNAVVIISTPASLEPTRIGRLPFIRAPVCDGGALGSFDRDLATERSRTSHFFANLRGDLQSGYFVEYDSACGATQPVHVNAYAYRPPGAEFSIDLGLLDVAGD